VRLERRGAVLPHPRAVRRNAWTRSRSPVGAFARALRSGGAPGEGFVLRKD